MAKDSAITVRLPDALKEHLRARAVAEHRSLSAEVVAVLERAALELPAPMGKGKFLGLYAGTALPTEEDFQEVRGRLWSRLGRRA